MTLGFWTSPHFHHLFCVQSSENVSRMRVEHHGPRPEGKTHSEKLLRQMSPILWLPGGGNMGIVEIHYGQLHLN